MKNKKGSVTIEAAISFTLVVILIACIVSAINLFRTDILMTRSVNQCCENMSLIYPVTVTAGDAASVLLNAFPDTGIEGTKASSVIGTVAKAVGGINSITGFKLEETALENLLAGTMAKNIRDCYIKRNGGSSFFCPDDIDVRFDISSKRHIIEVTVEYSVVTIAGRKHKTVFSVIPLYGDGSLILEGDEPKNGAKDIWSLDNFSRGEGFREIFGTNLPKLFPVIDDYKNGDIMALKTIDLTAPYYKSDNKIIRSIKEDIDELAGFKGAEKLINGKEYKVTKISGRTLTVVIPGNSPKDRKNVISSLKEYARSKGVKLVIKEYGKSTRYS